MPIPPQSSRGTYLPVFWLLIIQVCEQLKKGIVHMASNRHKGDAFAKGVGEFLKSLGHNIQPEHQVRIGIGRTNKKTHKFDWGNESLLVECKAYDLNGKWECSKCEIDHRKRSDAVFPVRSKAVSQDALHVDYRKKAQRKLRNLGGILSANERSPHTRRRRSL